MTNSYKKRLCETIMRNVRKSLKLNESFNGDSDNCSIVIEGPCKVAIGDPCYIFSDAEYDAMVDYLEDGGIMPDEKGLYHRTAYGDGEYNSMSNFLYGVDAGMFCICKVPADANNFEGLAKTIILPAGRHKLEMIYDDGTFSFFIDNKITEEIYTKEDDEEDIIDDTYENDADFSDEFEN